MDDIVPNNHLAITNDFLRKIHGVIPGSIAYDPEPYQPRQVIYWRRKKMVISATKPITIYLSAC